ncbi:hypothetical protein BgiBS90_026349, partial [Biomphalaria glabrata]
SSADCHNSYVGCFPSIRECTHVKLGSIFIPRLPLTNHVRPGTLPRSTCDAGLCVGSAVYSTSFGVCNYYGLSVPTNKDRDSAERSPVSTNSGRVDRLIFKDQELVTNHVLRFATVTKINCIHSGSQGCRFRRDDCD